MNVLYLLNHKTLTDFEVPILIKKGYGVYIPKLYQSLSIVNSINHATVGFYDNFLHIHPSDIATLNTVDWFSNQLLPLNIIHIINANFKCIFITLLTKPPLLDQLIHSFTGKVYYRLFGLEGAKSYVPTVRVHPKAGYIFSYSEIYDHECRDVFKKDNSYIVPLGLSNATITTLTNTWNRKNHSIVFVCSRIHPNCKYYYDIYRQFIQEFNQFNYIILGKNNETLLPNPKVFNNLPDSEYHRKISECACMYYHSKEPRHLHYHPLEAIVINIPIVFHQESLLSKYLGNSPGKCKDIDEVRSKIRRIIDGDNVFIQSILSAQMTARNTLMQCNHTGIFDQLL